MLGAKNARRRRAPFHTYIYMPAIQHIRVYIYKRQHPRRSANNAPQPIRLVARHMLQCLCVCVCICVRASTLHRQVTACIIQMKNVFVWAIVRRVSLGSRFDIEQQREQAGLRVSCLVARSCIVCALMLRCSAAVLEHCRLCETYARHRKARGGS